MKKTILLFTLIVGFSSLIKAQSRSNGSTTATVNNQSPFLDASVGAFNNSANLGKGLVFPRTDLTTFTFERDGTFLANATRYDGMIVYNTATGTTPAAGLGVRSGIGSQFVTPGFYYFSNPTSGSVVGNGEWLLFGGQSATVRSKLVLVTVAANPTTAILNLGTAVIAANEVNKFLGAKIYDSNGHLVLRANSAYDKATNDLTTGNGFMYQVLPAGDYEVVVEYN